METNRYWYFITDQNFGHEVTLKPRSILNAGDSEPLIKRICVAPTAAHCFAAIGVSNGSLMRVYRTKYKCKGIKPWGVPDQTLTREHWRRRPTRFVLCAELTVPDKASWPWGSRGGGKDDEHGWYSQKKDKRQIKEWLERLGDRRLYVLSEANVKWRMKNAKAIYDARRAVSESISMAKEERLGSGVPRQVPRPDSDWGTTGLSGFSFRRFLADRVQDESIRLLSRQEKEIQDKSAAWNGKLAIHANPEGFGWD
jgi:hypothetical protein